MEKQRKGRKSSAIEVRLRKEVGIQGRLAERKSLGEAIGRGRLPSALLLTGAQGVGKARLAGWLAQALVCSGDTHACGTCLDCRLAGNLEHPDIHWYFPHGSPGSGSLDAQIEQVHAIRAKELEVRREDALYPGAPTGSAYYLATIQALRREARQRPAMAKRKVFILTDADRLTVTDGDIGAAANALLKTLEEPAAGTHLILTSSVPHRILPTIISRLSEFRISPLKESEVADILKQALPDLSDADRHSIAARARGSLRAARESLTEEWKEVREKALELVEAAVVGDVIRRCSAVNAQGGKGARQEFTVLLDHIEEVVLLAGEKAAGLGGPRVADSQESALAIRQPDVAAWAEAIGVVAEARAKAQLNAIPRLVLHTLLCRLEKIMEV